jgi:hypothetical protein
MSLLYKPYEEQTTTMEVKTFSNDTLIVVHFYRDCGKFGMEEMLAGFTLTADRLLQILHERKDITDEELD